MTKLTNLFGSTIWENKNWRIFKRKKDVLNGFMMSFVLATTALSGTSDANAAPTGGNITQGSGSISQSGLNTDINQQSQNLNINWQTFSSNVNESINFSQPNVSAIAINRVIGGVPSILQGALNANGNVFILNNAGITFSGTSRVNVGSLLATTARNITFRDGKYEFTDADGGIISNIGTINVSNGGFAVLAAPQVNNSGYIQANLGTIELASTTALTLDLRGDNLITYAVSEDVLKDAGVTNTGTLAAKSGRIAISTNIASDLVSGVVNLGGIIDADAFGKNADGGTVLVTSRGLANFKNSALITAQGGSESGDGGFVEVSGKNVIIAGSVDTRAANGKIGTFLIDPANITIEDGAAPVTPAIDTLYEENLENQATSIIVEADESITINNLSDDLLDVAKGGIDKSITITGLDDDSTITSDVSDTIRTVKGDINLEAGTINVGNLETGGKSVENPGEINITTKDAGFSAENIQIIGSGGEAKLSIDATGDVNVANIKVHNIEKDKAGDVGSSSNPVLAEAIINSEEGSVTISGDIDVKAEAVAGEAIDVIIEYLNSGDAGYNNSFGYYYTDESGEPTDGVLTYENIKNIANGTTFVVTVANESDIGFFLVPNGSNLNSSSDGDGVIFRKESGVWNVYSDGVKLDGANDLIAFGNNLIDPSATTGFNADTIVHLKDDSVVGGNANWEDLHADVSDLDFNDANFNITSEDAEGGSAFAKSYVEINAQSDVNINGNASSVAVATSTNGGDDNEVGSDARLYINAGADANLNNTDVSANASQDEGGAANSFAELSIFAGTQTQRVELPIADHEHEIDHSADFIEIINDLDQDSINHDGDSIAPHEHEVEYEETRGGDINLAGSTNVNSEASSDAGSVNSDARSRLNAYNDVNVDNGLSVSSSASNDYFYAEDVTSSADSRIVAGNDGGAGDVTVNDDGVSVTSNAESSGWGSSVSSEANSTIIASGDIIFNDVHSVSSTAIGNSGDVTSSASIIENAGGVSAPLILDGDDDDGGDEEISGNITHNAAILLDSQAISSGYNEYTEITSDADLRLSATGNIDLQSISINSIASDINELLLLKSRPGKGEGGEFRPMESTKEIHSNVDVNIYAENGDVNIGNDGLRIGSRALSAMSFDQYSYPTEPESQFESIGGYLSDIDVTSNVDVNIESAEGDINISNIAIRSLARAEEGYFYVDATKTHGDGDGDGNDDPQYPDNNVNVRSDVDVYIEASQGTVTTDGISSRSAAFYSNGYDYYDEKSIEVSTSPDESSTGDIFGDVVSTNDIAISGAAVNVNGENIITSDAVANSYNPVDAYASSSLRLTATNGDLNIDGDIALDSRASSMEGIAIADAAETGRASDDFTLTGDIDILADAADGATAKNDNESGTDGNGDWNQRSGGLTATANAIIGDAYALVRGAAPDDDDLTLADDDAQATADDAETIGKFTDVETVGSDTAELIFRNEPTSSSSSGGSSSGGSSSGGSSSGSSSSGGSSSGGSSSGGSSSGGSSSGGSSSGGSSSGGSSSGGPIPQPPVIPPAKPPVVPPKVEEPPVVKQDGDVPVIIALQESKQPAQQKDSLNDLSPAAGGNVEGSFCSVVNVNGSKICN